MDVCWIKKAECQRIDAFELRCWRRLLRVSWTVRRCNKSILMKISPEYSLEGLMLKLKLQYFGHLMQGEVKSLSRVRFFATPWTVAYQAPPSMRFSRQEYWSGLPCLPPGDLPNSGTEPESPALQAYSLPAELQGKN